LLTPSEWGTLHINLLDSKSVLARYQFSWTLTVTVAVGLVRMGSNTKMQRPGYFR
jgi:hypothetical protein